MRCLRQVRRLSLRDPMGPIQWRPSDVHARGQGRKWISKINAASSSSNLGSSNFHCNTVDWALQHCHTLVRIRKKPNNTTVHSTAPPEMK
jgi:hypothetical protein